MEIKVFFFHEEENKEQYTTMAAIDLPAGNSLHFHGNRKSSALICQLQLPPGFGESKLFPYANPFKIKSCASIVTVLFSFVWRQIMMTILSCISFLEDA